LTAVIEPWRRGGLGGLGGAGVLGSPFPSSLLAGVGLDSFCGHLLLGIVDRLC
jgi:hypothetical protein